MSQVEVPLGRLGGERFGNSCVSYGWDLCLLLQKKGVEGAVSLDPY